MAIETGGPAFPHIDSAMGRFEAGMTLRDYFAAKAMQAIASRMDTGALPALHIASISYQLADHMISERKGGV